ncbi:hypothetical protein [Segetibacter aerophilus]|uniref:hypothetical protein n=1 Tax=Segetibacter aerophilus TaxID=670293 RepID=UPI0011BFD2B6|nr:hypothetical protein [Segetibacter aerophilus]
MPLIIYFGIACLFIGTLSASIWFSNSSYSSLLNFVTDTLKRPDLKPLIQKSLFPPKKYQLIYKFHWMVYPVILAVTIALYLNVRKISVHVLFAIRYIQSTLFHIIIFFKALPAKEKLLLGAGAVIYVFLILYNNHLKEISYDEAWGYNYYINKHFYFPFILFNTYPLFNLITHFFTFLPFDTLVNIRIPSLLFGLLSLLGLFYILYKRAGFALSALALAILAASPLFYIYTSLSRGITLSLFISILITQIILRITDGNTFSKRYRFLFIILNILGIISMPTFFVFTICNSIFLYYYTRHLKPILTSAAVIFVASFLWYLPVLLTSGVSLISHNNHYTFNIIDTINRLSDFLFGLSQLFFSSKYIMLLLLSLAFVSLPLKPLAGSKKTIIDYCLFVIIFTLTARAITGNIFPERSLNCLITNCILIFISLISIFVRRTNASTKAVLTLSSIAIFSYLCIRNQKELLGPVEDKDAKIVGDLLIRNDIENGYIDEEEFWFCVPMIEYYYSEAQKNIHFSTSAINSTRYKAFSADDKYDCIITKTTSSNNYRLDYKELFRNNSFVIWMRLRNMEQKSLNYHKK